MEEFFDTFWEVYFWLIILVIVGVSLINKNITTKPIKEIEEQNNPFYIDDKPPSQRNIEAGYFVPSYIKPEEQKRCVLLHRSGECFIEVPISSTLGDVQEMIDNTRGATVVREVSNSIILTEEEYIDNFENFLAYQTEEQFEDEQWTIDGDAVYYKRYHYSQSYIKDIDHRDEVMSLDEYHNLPCPSYMITNVTGKPFDGPEFSKPETDDLPY